MRYAVEAHPYRHVVQRCLDAPSRRPRPDARARDELRSQPHVPVWRHAAARHPRAGPAVFHCHFSDNDALTNAHWRPGAARSTGAPYWRHFATSASMARSPSSWKMCPGWPPRARNRPPPSTKSTAPAVTISGSPAKVWESAGSSGSGSTGTEPRRARRTRRGTEGDEREELEPQTQRAERKRLVKSWLRYRPVRLFYLTFVLFVSLWFFCPLPLRAPSVPSVLSVVHFPAA